MYSNPCNIHSNEKTCLLIETTTLSITFHLHRNSWPAHDDLAPLFPFGQSVCSLQRKRIPSVARQLPKDSKQMVYCNRLLTNTCTVDKGTVSYR